MLQVFGLKNCDTCRKARKWMDAEGVSHAFIDVRADGITRDSVSKWVDAVGVDTLLNRRGTTWRGLSDAEKDIADEEAAVDLMLAYPALVKRPVFDRGQKVYVGFTAAVKAAILDKS